MITPPFLQRFRFRQLALVLGGVWLCPQTTAFAIDAYVVAGQSNGWRLSSLAQGVESKDGAKVHYFGMKCVSEPDSSDLVTLTSLSPNAMGSGLARALLERAGGRDIVFIQYSRCGAPVTGEARNSWWPGEDPANGKRFDGGLFTSFGRYLESARVQVKAKLGEELVIKGLFWHQGESNANQDRAIYEKAVRNVFWRLRDVTKVPDLPIVAGHIRNLGEGPAGINATLDRLANEDSRLLTVSLDGRIEYAPDRDGRKDVHIGLAGCHELGRRMVAGLGLLVDGPAKDSFHIHAPSPLRNALLTVTARPAGSGVILKLTRTLALGFRAMTIAGHPAAPVLHVSGAPGKSGHNGATVFLAANQSPARHELLRLDRDYAYLSPDRTGRFLLGCNYGTGHVDVYPLGRDHVPGARVAGVDEGRKEAHCVLPSPDNRFVYIPYVKGNNALFQYAFNAETGALTPLDPKNANPPPGTGPRHLAYHPALPVLYFSEEQGLGVSLYRQAGDGRLTFWKRARAAGDDAPTEGVSSSDIVITPDARFVFAGIRGHKPDFDFIAGYKVLSDGGLDPVGLTPADKIPWGMAVSPDGRHLVATGFQSATLMVYTIGGDGKLTRSGTLSWDKNISDVVVR